MTRFSFSSVLVCQCGDLMIPNISTEDKDGLAWICLKASCGDAFFSELEAEDLEAVGVPSWLARQLVALIEDLS